MKKIKNPDAYDKAVKRKVARHSQTISQIRGRLCAILDDKYSGYLLGVDVHEVVTSFIQDGALGPHARKTSNKAPKIETLKPLVSEALAQAIQAEEIILTVEPNGSRMYSLPLRVPEPIAIDTVVSSPEVDTADQIEQLMLSTVHPRTLMEWGVC